MTSSLNDFIEIQINLIETKHMKTLVLRANKQKKKKQWFFYIQNGESSSISLTHPWRAGYGPVHNHMSQIMFPYVPYPKSFQTSWNDKWQQICESFLK